MIVCILAIFLKRLVNGTSLRVEPSNIVRVKIPTFIMLSRVIQIHKMIPILICKELWLPQSRSSRPKVLCKISVFKNFSKFIVKHQCQSLFLIKLRAYNFIEKRLHQRCFLENFAKFLKTLILQYTSEHLFLIVSFKFKKKEVSYFPSIV